MQSVFQDTLTDFIKGAPSATALHQANDQNAAFRDTKTGMDTITRNGIDTSNTTLAKHFKDVIIILKMEHPEIVLSATNETKMIKAVETLTYVQKNGYVSSRKNIMSYQVWYLISQLHAHHICKTYRDSISYRFVDSTAHQTWNILDAACWVTTIVRYASKPCCHYAIQRSQKKHWTICSYMLLK